MELSAIGVPIVLGGVVLLAVLAGILLMRALPRREGLSPAERKEMAGAPMPGLQKRAWWGLIIGVAVLATLTAILTTRGAAAYWEDDDLRLLVVGIFLGGLAAYVVLLLMSAVKEFGTGGVDERDRLVLSRAPTVQSPAILITLAAWLVALTRIYHDPGAVPVVYLYLMFGSVIIVNMIGHSVGILLGYWIVSRYGQG